MSITDQTRELTVDIENQSGALGGAIIAAAVPSQPDCPINSEPILDNILCTEGPQLPVVAAEQMQLNSQNDMNSAGLCAAQISNVAQNIQQSGQITHSYDSHGMAPVPHEQLFSNSLRYQGEAMPSQPYQGDSMPAESLPPCDKLTGNSSLQQMRDFGSNYQNSNPYSSQCPSVESNHGSIDGTGMPAVQTLNPQQMAQSSFNYHHGSSSTHFATEKQILSPSSKPIAFGHMNPPSEFPTATSIPVTQNTPAPYLTNAPPGVHVVPGSVGHAQPNVAEFSCSSGYESSSLHSSSPYTSPDSITNSNPGSCDNPPQGKVIIIMNY